MSDENNKGSPLFANRRSKIQSRTKSALVKKNASFVEFYCYVISVLDSTLKNEFHGILLIDDGICLRRSSQFSTR